MTKVIEGPESSHFARVEREIVLRRTDVQRKEIKAVVTMDDREIKTLTIQRFSQHGDPHPKLHFSFIGSEIDALIEFVMAVKAMPLDGKTRYLSDDEVRQLVLNSAQKLRLLNDDPELIAQLVENSVAMLLRAILDHVPPIFGASNFAGVIGQHGGKSFKEQMRKLEDFLRNIADQFLHEQIRRREPQPTDRQVHFAQPLDTLLGEVAVKLT